jgi:hypothetical protein
MVQSLLILENFASISLPIISQSSIHTKPLSAQEKPAHEEQAHEEQAHEEQAHEEQAHEEQAYEEQAYDVRHLASILNQHCSMQKKTIFISKQVMLSSVANAVFTIPNLIRTG